MDKTGHRITGKITSIDRSNYRLVVSHEDSFVLPKTFDFKALKIGEMVDLSYESKDGHLNASDVRPHTNRH